MSDEQKHTRKLSLDDTDMQEFLAEQRKQTPGEVRIGKSREVLLLVDQGIRRVELRNDVTYLLGRFSKSKPGANHIDLDPFGARDRGVSRIHAQIHMEDNILYITDMDSTNGTYVDGVQIEPHTPYQLRQGSNIVLGRMNLQIMSKSSRDTAGTD